MSDRTQKFLAGTTIPRICISVEIIIVNMYLDNTFQVLDFDIIFKIFFQWSLQQMVMMLGYQRHQRLHNPTKVNL